MLSRNRQRCRHKRHHQHLQCNHQQKSGEFFVLLFFFYFPVCVARRFLVKRQVFFVCELFKCIRVAFQRQFLPFIEDDDIGKTGYCRRQFCMKQTAIKTTSARALFLFYLFWSIILQRYQSASYVSYVCCRLTQQKVHIANLSKFFFDRISCPSFNPSIHLSQNPYMSMSLFNFHDIIQFQRFLHRFLP